MRLRLRVERGKLVVPESAVQEGVDGRYAWRVEANLATMVPVRVERSYRQQDTNGSLTSLAVLGGGNVAARRCGRDGGATSPDAGRASNHACGQAMILHFGQKESPSPYR